MTRPESHPIAEVTLCGDTGGTGPERRLIRSRAIIPFDLLPHPLKTSQLSCNKLPMIAEAKRALKAKLVTVPTPQTGFQHSTNDPHRHRFEALPIRWTPLLSMTLPMTQAKNPCLPEVEDVLFERRQGFVISALLPFAAHSPLPFAVSSRLRTPFWSGTKVICLSFHAS